MKGHIFNLLEDFLIEVTDIQVYESLLAQCQFSTEEGFVRTANYPDEQLYELVDHAVAYLGITTAQAHYSFGQWLFPRLVNMVPDAMCKYTDPGEFLETIDYIHSVELKKLYPDAKPPQFAYQQESPGAGVLTYNSPRVLFDLVEGVLQGLADYFKVTMQVTRNPRPDLGEGVCEFRISYSR